MNAEARASIALDNARACEHCAETLERLARDDDARDDHDEATRRRGSARWHWMKAAMWMQEAADEEDEAA